VRTEDAFVGGGLSVSDDILHRITKLVADECANHFRELNGRKNDCRGRADHKCVFFGEPQDEMPRCGYFERGVVPLDREIQSSLFLAGPKAASSPQARVKCVRCREFFVAASGRQQYCPKCRESVRREQSRARMWKQRRGVS
jgi:hypothetical protein